MSETLARLKHWKVTRDSDEIVWLVIDRAGEKVNSLSRAVLEEFDAIVETLERDTPRGIVLISGKSTGFILGADVKEFDAYRESESVAEGIQHVHQMFARFEALRCTKVAAIEGYCLGGGLELALCCDYRIAKNVAATRIGFPELQLGIYPGFGGSARATQLLGGLKAMPAILTAKQYRAGPAKNLGLVDALVGRHAELHWAARRAVLQGKRSRGPGIIGRLSNFGPIRRYLAEQMRKQTRKKARPEHYPAPYAAIDAWAAYGDDKAAMLKEEARAVSELMVGETSQGLRRVFQLMERLKSIGRGSSFRTHRVHVIGAGVMGGDIAAWCVVRGLEVSLQDREIKYVQPALNRAKKLFRKRLRDANQVKAALARLHADVDGNHVDRADVVIEAIFENLEAKQALFKKLEPRLKAGAILASNTSAIPLEELAKALKKPQRLIGLHFFNPVPKMPLVEIVAGKRSSKPNLQKAAAFVGQIGKFPLPVKSSPGFLVNRILAPYMMQALSLRLEGIPAEAIDEAAERFGMPMGPLELSDTVGLDVCLMVTGVLGEKQGEAEKAEIKRYVDAGKLGKKSGEGVYRWEKGKPRKIRERIRGHDLKAIAERLITAYTDECQAALADGIVEDADLLDAGMIFGTGFAPFLGGPMHFLQQTSTLTDES